MKRKWVLGLTFVSSLAIFTATAYPWGAATHAYVAKQIGKSTAAAEANEIYGIMVPDLVNFMLNSPYRNYLYDQTHHNALRVWRQARNGRKYELEQALGFGFAAHNDSWGGDFTAHHDGRTWGQGVGYVIAKAALLESNLGSYGIWVALGVDGPEYAPLRLELCHEVIEIAVDVRVWMLDNGIGTSVLQANQTRDDNMRELLQRAFAGNLVAYSNQIDMPLNQPQAEALLFDAEANFRQTMAMYGFVFTLPTMDLLITGLADYLVILAQQGYGLSIPPAQIESAIGAGLLFTEDAFAEIIETVAYIQEQLAAYKVQY